MLPPTVQLWLKRTASLWPLHEDEDAGPGSLMAAAAAAELAAPDGAPLHSPTAETVGPPNPWPPDRLAVTNHLWGDGFILPGGEIETMRLTYPLGLSSAASLMLVGVGGGGPACCIAKNLGAWVTAYEVEDGLIEQARALLKASAMSRKATVERWNPQRPDFPARHFHHCVAIEPLRCGGEPAHVMDSLAQALKVGGQLVMAELCADAPLDAGDAATSRWSRIDHRPLPTILPPTAITRMLRRVGFDVRVAEDISRRHIENVLIGWRVAVRHLRQHKPDPLLAARLVAEAELWLLRVRLLRQERLRMVRWHAISTATAPHRS